MDYLVDAIDEGKIIKVSEEYARQEGLPILRKPKTIELQEKAAQLSLGSKSSRDDDEPMFDPSKRPLNWRENQVVSELIDNFHWVIRVQRRKRGISRKQLAFLINEPEEHVKSIEYGILPSKDFVLINKIQSALGINLRKDKKDFSKSVKELLQPISTQQPQTPLLEKDRLKSMYGSDIEILEDEV